MPAIVIDTGPLRNRRFRLPEKGNVTIGRNPQCTLVLPDGMLADVQCILRFQSGHWTLENRDEDRRTFINDRRVTRTALNSGDAVRMGQTLLTYVGEDKDPLLSTQVAGYAIQIYLSKPAWTSPTIPTCFSGKGRSKTIRCFYSMREPGSSRKNAPC